MSPQGGEATVDVLSGREAVIPAVDGAPDAPLRIETRFRLHRWRDLLPFLWDAIGLVVAFRSSAGAHVMWLKGKPWRLEFGSYSEWKDEGSMRRYVGGSGHRTALRHAVGDWAAESWHVYDGAAPIFHQRCRCGAVMRGDRRAERCSSCGRTLPRGLDSPPSRPARGVPISFRIPASRRVRRASLGGPEVAGCERCGFVNPRGTAYCLSCGARTHLVASRISELAWVFTFAVVVLLAASFLGIAVYLLSRWI